MTTLLLVGASVRAAAWSALRCRSLKPWCVDLFADADLKQVCPATVLPACEYPRGLIAAARLAPPGPLMYTGALENHPVVIEALSKERPLWGNSGEVVRRLRSPAKVAAVLEKAGLPCPAVAEGAPPDLGKAWLVKPRKSAAGANIRRWHGQPVGPGYYCQEWIDGDPCSALYLGRADRTAAFLGATRQLIGESWLHARPFGYCGSVGPLSLEPETNVRMQGLGEILVREFSLRGLFGLDFILRAGVPWPVEVNPRYTASVEVLERARGIPFLEEHRQAFEFSANPQESACLPFAAATIPEKLPATGTAGGEGPGVRGENPAWGVPLTPNSSPPPNSFPRLPRFGGAGAREAIFGKAILFAQEPLVFPADGPWRKSLGPEGDGEFADIPHPGTRIETGHPLVTIFAQAESEADCLEQLRQKVQALDRKFAE